MDVEDTLVLILERINSAVTLIRAASTCRRWRRIIADSGFLRRYRSLHGPDVAGDYYNGYDHHKYNYPWTTSWITITSSCRYSPWFVPSSASIDACHFSLDFVIGTFIFQPRSWDDEAWEVVDSRGSLLLMEYSSHDLVVCEPLTQRYTIIPQPPEYDAANCRVWRGPFLLDGNEDEAGGRIGMSNFRVLCVFFSFDDGVRHTTVFTAAGDMDATWSEQAIDHVASRENMAYPCEFPWPPVLQACLD